MLTKLVMWRSPQWFVAALSLLLTACGSGGGGGSSNAVVNYSDGLGVAGLATGTVVIGYVAFPLNFYPFPGKVTVALDDNDRALAVWRMYDSNSVAWSQSDSSGVWDAQQPLTQVSGVTSQFSTVLRMNASGNAVLGWVDSINGAIAKRTARFIRGTGWDTSAYDASGGSEGCSPSYGFIYSWDLTMLSDDSFVSGICIFANGIYSLNAQRQPISGSSVLSLTTPLINTPKTFFLATRPDGASTLSWAIPSSGSPNNVDILAELGSVYSGVFAPFTIGTYSRLCNSNPIDDYYGYSAYFNPLVVTTSPTFYSVFAVVAQDTASPPNQNPCTLHDLELIRLDTRLGIHIESSRANSAGSVITVAPQIVMDKNGNALAVWKESSGTTSSAQVQLMWSASLQGGPWSSAQPVISNLSEVGTIGRTGEISLAMNDNGQAIATLVSRDDTDISLNIVSYGRFSFVTGWTTWKRIANKSNIGDPKVAINQSGNAVIVFSALDVDRVRTGPWPSNPATNIYAFGPP